MSDCKDQGSKSTLDNLSSELRICLFSTQPQFIQSVEGLLNGDRAPKELAADVSAVRNTATHKPSHRRRYKLECFSLTEELIDFITQNQEQIDCIVLIDNLQLNPIVQRLWDLGILLPTVIIETEESIKCFLNSKKETDDSEKDVAKNNLLYHRAEIRLYPTQMQEISSYIKLAITKFLNLAPNSEINQEIIKNEHDLEENTRKSLVIKQRRLTDKIKERLGYLGVYYKRNSADFYRNLSSADKQKLNLSLSVGYRKILLNYFEDNQQINQLIDEFVDRAFFANVSTSQILEIHMDLIDEFSHQLQIEGRNDDILLDYRLPLIDVIAHLCEMYRRSIPGEDISLELLFGVE